MSICKQEKLRLSVGVRTAESLASVACGMGG